MESLQQRFDLSFNPLIWFKKPRTQQDIIKKCKGDIWAANKLQNQLLNYGTIKTVLIDTEDYPQYLHYILA